MYTVNIYFGGPDGYMVTATFPIIPSVGDILIVGDYILEVLSRRLTSDYLGIDLIVKET